MSKYEVKGNIKCARYLYPTGGYVNTDRSVVVGTDEMNCFSVRKERPPTNSIGKSWTTDQPNPPYVVAGGTSHKIYGTVNCLLRAFCVYPTSNGTTYIAAALGGFIGGYACPADVPTNTSFATIHGASCAPSVKIYASTNSSQSSYVNDLTLQMYSVTSQQTLEPTGITVPITCKDSIVSLGSSNKTTYKDKLAITSNMNQPNQVSVFSNGTTVVSTKPNTKFLLNIKTGNKIDTSVSNLLTCLFWTYLIVNPGSTEQEALSMLETKTGIANTAYNYIQNDFYYNYAMQNPAKFTLETEPTGVSTMDYPLLCVRMSSQICFLWDVIYYYAVQQALTVDPNFALQFYELIYTNMNGTDIMLTKALINATFPGLIPEDVDLDSTIIYWVGLINIETNIVNLLILKHICDFFNILEGGISPLLENNVTLLSQEPYNVTYAAVSQTVTEIFDYVGPIYLQNGINQNVFLNAPKPTPPEPPVPPEPTPINDICFPASTPVVTDDGIISIEEIDPAFHTIDSKKILAITKTISTDKYLVCFEKDSLGKNFPSDKTVVSNQHKISYKGKLIEAYKFLGHFSNVHKTAYNGEVLYNILLEDHGRITINNMICETLHPNNAVAKLYTSPMPSSIKNKMIVLMNELSTKKDAKTYKKVLQYF